MYGTIAHFRVKPGMGKKIIERLRAFENARVPGAIATYLYRMDDDTSDYYIAVIFASKDAYQANADSSEQNERYQEMLAMVDGEPEWHDGSDSYAQSISASLC